MSGIAFASCRRCHARLRQGDVECEVLVLLTLCLNPSSGLIVSHNRPTLYSPSSRTALAEAELEYRDDHVSRSVYVKFPVASLGEGLETALEALKIDHGKEKISLAAWTTTPWTLPSNLVSLTSQKSESRGRRKAVLSFFDFLRRLRCPLRWSTRLSETVQMSC